MSEDAIAIRPRNECFTVSEWSISWKEKESVIYWRINANLIGAQKPADKIIFVYYTQSGILLVAISLGNRIVV